MSEYLYAFDLAMEQTGVVIFNLETLKPDKITSISTKTKSTHGERLDHIYRNLRALEVDYTPSVIAIERGFSRYPTSTQVIFRVHGLINWMYHDLEQVYYPPKKVKEAIVSGTATKKAVQKRILDRYEVEFANEDESDAFAVGICYLIKNRGMQWERRT